MSLNLIAPHDKDALVSEPRRVSYRELIQRARSLAESIAAAPGTQVVIFAENSIEWAIAAYAIWAAGKVLVPIDAQSTKQDVAYILRDCKTEQIYVGEQTSPVLDEALVLLEEEKPEVIPLRGVSDAPARGADGPIFVEDESRLATIIYTSGTTGDPKGVMLTFANLHANLRVVLEVGYFPPDERVLLLLPLHHVLPLMGCLVGPIAAGATSVLCPSLARDDIIRTLKEHKITMIVGVPRFYELLGSAISDRIQSSLIARSLYASAQRIERREARARLFKKIHQGFGGHVRYLICGGAPLDPKTANLFTALGFRMCEGYGMTECAPLITFPKPDEAKPGYCGKVVPGAQVELREGEIVVKGPQVMNGYFNRPEETAEILRDGWLFTGDLGSFDEEGNLKITGRKKEILILPSGKNVNPQLSEVMLEAHPEVAEAGVFLDDGVLHGLLLLNPGRVPGTEQDEESYIWSKVVADYNRRVAPYRQLSRLTVVDEPLPRTRLGKLRRHLLIAPDRSSEFDEATEASSETERQLIVYLLRHCQKVVPESRLGADLGIDSMARLELREFIRKTWSAPFNEAEITDRLRVSELAGLVDQRAGGTGTSAEVDWDEILSGSAEVKLPSTSGLHLTLLIGLRGAARLWMRLVATGQDHLPSGPKLFAPNHESALDGVFLTACLPLSQAREVFFLAKEDHMKHPLMRYVAARCRIIVLDQSTGLLNSLQVVVSALKRGHSVVVFPEGTRTTTGELGDFKESYAIVAKHTRVPIVPVALQGAREALPKGTSLPRIGKRVAVQFLSSLRVADSPTETNDLVRARIEEVLTGLRP